MLDERSFALDLEISVFIADRDFRRRMDAVVAEFLEASTLLDFDAWNRRPLWHKYADNVARLTSALL